MDLLKNKDYIFNYLFLLFISISLIIKSSSSFIYILYGTLSCSYYISEIKYKNIIHIKVLFLVTLIFFINSVILANSHGIRILDSDARYLFIPFIVLILTRTTFNYKMVVLILTLVNVLIFFQCLYGPYNLAFGSRWHTSLIDPNSLGVVAVLSLYFVFFINNIVPNRVLLMINIVIFGIIIFKTEARAAIIAYSLVLLMMPYKNKKIYFILYLLIALIYSRLGTLHIDTLNIINSLSSYENILSSSAINSSNSSIYDRILMVIYSCKVGYMFPLTGIGYANLSESLYNLFPNIDSKIHDILVCCGTHNEIFSSLFHKGFIAFVLHAIILFYSLFFISRQNYKTILLYNFIIVIISFGTEYTNLKYLQAFFLMWHSFLIAHLIKAKSY